MDNKLLVLIAARACDKKKAKEITKDIKKIQVIHWDKRVNSSRSINIINYLVNRKKLKNIYFIIGADNLINFHKWKDWKRIVKLTKLIVFSRKGYDRKGGKSTVTKYYKNKITFIKNRPIVISSTKLRKKLVWIIDGSSRYKKKYWKDSW